MARISENINIARVKRGLNPLEDIETRTQGEDKFIELALPSGTSDTFHLHLVNVTTRQCSNRSGEVGGGGGGGGGGGSHNPPSALKILVTDIGNA